MQPKPNIQKGTLRQEQFLKMKL